MIYFIIDISISVNWMNFSDSEFGIFIFEILLWRNFFCNKNRVIVISVIDWIILFNIYIVYDIVDIKL